MSYTELSDDQYREALMKLLKNAGVEFSYSDSTQELRRKCVEASITTVVL